MKRKRFTEEQIIGVLKESEALSSRSRRIRSDTKRFIPADLNDWLSNSLPSATRYRRRQLVDEPAAALNRWLFIVFIGSYRSQQLSRPHL
jgi:hypothetical protein